MSYADTLKANGMSYEQRLSLAVNRWLGCDRRSLVDIVDSGDLNAAELDAACDVADMYDVAGTDVVIEIGRAARAEVSR